MNRNYAVSYRAKPFRVGCAALTLDPDLPDDQPAIHPGANYKPTKEAVKRCAEKHAIEGAIAYKTKLIIAIAIVSEEETTGDGDKSCGALHPCLECRKMYRELKGKGILRDDSIICSANDSEIDVEGMPSVIKEMSVKDLLELYKDDPEE